MSECWQWQANGKFVFCVVFVWPFAVSRQINYRAKHAGCGLYTVHIPQRCSEIQLSGKKHLYKGPPKPAGWTTECILSWLVRASWHGYHSPSSSSWMGSESWVHTNWFKREPANKMSSLFHFLKKNNLCTDHICCAKDKKTKEQLLTSK